ncbi:RNA cytidine acetyltransferase 1-like isoform X3 [Coffea arabica]|nr:RNA cytidine acetyltransferase 1-like isoform X1 [Coffea arabica]XP_027113322.1 RNA cytidine acetyltransferase 1-like isoform X1 [Coffea arabica]
MRKKVDERIRSLIENGVRMRHRSMFVIIGDKSRDQIVNLHYLLSKAVIKSRPTVLWCYKDKLELSSHKKKRAKQVKKLMQRGLLDPEKVDPFSLFIESGGVSFCLYRDSDRILGNTYGMCILQDFEALTPNILARSIETVEGGGLVILLLRSLSSLSSLYTMVMDVHERFRTEAHHNIVSRFNERFLLSLGTCKSCLVMDDELNILPISSHVKSMNMSSIKEGQLVSIEGQDLLNVKEQLHDVFPIGPLVKICTTLDQTKAVSTFLDAILDKTLQTTIALTASRGRGKSAALGLAIAGAIAVGYSNIFVTAPSPQNLSSLFEFVQRGLRALKYEEHLHYDILRSDASDSRKTAVQINIYKQHRQTVQYVQPRDHQKLSQVELLVIDEAAAIPLPVIKSLLGPSLVFLSSTVNGYEGTGRSLSLKLLSHLEKNSQISAAGKNDCHSVRKFQKLELKESIRYAAGDPIESWLNNLLCLDATSSVPPISRFCHPSECKLYYVNRDTLFSFHKESEIFLQQIMSLFVASHYKNSPNDLQLMADAPAHHLFVLLGPVDESKNILPDVFCVLQVCLEGQISRDSALQCLHKGRLPSGDQIPWKFCEEFEDTGFPSLSGVRVVRIAVHPSALAHGYGSAALDQLTRYYEGQLSHISEIDIEMKEETTLPKKVTEAAEKVSLLEERVSPRENLPPLLVHLQERLPEKVDYIGASFGLTGDLFRFWKKHKFVPFYICDTPNNITGEHSCMVLKPLETNEMEGSSVCSPGFLHPFYQCFRQRFMRRLPLCFQELDYKLAMSILDPKINYLDHEPLMSSNRERSMLMKLIISADDLKLLEAYANNRKEYTKVRDMVPLLAQCYFQEQLPVTLSYLQASILLCMGLQLHDVTYIEQGKMNIERQQVLSLFRKVMTRFHKYLYHVLTEEFETSFAKQKEVELLPHDISMEEDLEDGAKRVRKEMNQENVGFIDPKSHLLQQYSVVDREADFEHALRSCTAVSPGTLLSVKSNTNGNGKLGSKRKAGETKNRKRGHITGSKLDPVAC